MGEEADVAAVSRAAENLERAVREALDELTEDAKDAAAIVRDSAMPAPFDYDDDYDPIKNRKMKCEDPDEENPKDHRVNKNDCKSAGVRVRTAEENARAHWEASRRGLGGGGRAGGGALVAEALQAAAAAEMRNRARAIGVDRGGFTSNSMIAVA